MITFNHIFICPFVRFAIRVPLLAGDRHGPRICYVPSLYLIESGCGSIIYEDRPNIQLQPGTLLFIQPGVSHTWEVDVDGPLTFRCVFFEWSYRLKTGVRIPNDLLCQRSEKSDDCLLDVQLDCGIPYSLVVDSISLWKGMFEAVTSEFEVVSPDLSVLDHEDYPNSLAITGHFNLLLHQIYRLARRQSDITDPRITKLIASMERLAGGEYEDVEGWAEKLGLSRSHFHALFRTHTGFTPKWYWNRCRINKARNDLLSTNDTVTVIAERYGFSSVHAFTKLFQKMEGVAPTVFRRQYRLI
ncbi:helix-turn-helix domain-containing protein [Bacillus sp. FJAT-28004]|uniref:helix-turn-helix domain-containing protein n=1 Tax=Bacillus sp. FJAT-28004 TaxID=1679165 RepID=UPI000B1350DC|nr:AraC family transcriptional regulator [Bacillus sp. FJAT-28004]